MQPDELEQARRALYAPGARPEDLRAYADLAQRRQDTASGPVRGPAAPRPRSGPRSAAVRVGLSAAVAVLAVGAVLLHAPAPRPGALTPTADPALWSPQHRARTAAVLKAALSPAPGADRAAAMQRLDDLLSSTHTGTGPTEWGLGTGNGSPSITGEGAEARAATITLALDRRTALDWTAEITTITATSKTGSWQLQTSTEQRHATTAAAPDLPLSIRLPLKPSATAGSRTSVVVHVHAPVGVRYLWILQLGR